MDHIGFDVENRIGHLEFPTANFQLKNFANLSKSMWLTALLTDSWIFQMIAIGRRHSYVGHGYCVSSDSARKLYEEKEMAKYLQGVFLCRRRGNMKKTNF
jgi:hypothetical protein